MKIAVKYGLIIAIAIALGNSFFLDLFGIEYEFVRKFSGFVPVVFLAVGLFFAMKRTKKEMYHDKWNYGQAIYSGIVICAFTALFLGIINFMYFQFINPGYTEKAIRIAIPLMEKDKLDATAIDAQIKQMRDSYMPINQLTGTFVFVLIAGIVFSAIFSAILRTEDTFTQLFKPKE